MYFYKSLILQLGMKATFFHFFFSKIPKNVILQVFNSTTYEVGNLFSNLISNLPANVILQLGMKATDFTF